LPERLVQIQFHLALITLYSTPEQFIAAVRANVPGFFILNPFFGPDLSPVRNSSQDDLLANSHGKIFDIPTRKFITLMAPGVPFFLGALSDVALSAMHELFIRQTAAALDIFGRKVFAARQGAFAWDPSLVQSDQAFLQFFVLVAVCDIDGADSAVEPARRSKIRIYRHGSTSPYVFALCAAPAFQVSLAA
jgi:hypothetical protein